MAFKVVSDSFKDGDHLPKALILSADFGFGCTGGNARAAWTSLRRNSLRWRSRESGRNRFPNPDPVHNAQESLSRTSPAR